MMVTSRRVLACYEYMLLMLHKSICARDRENLTHSGFTLMPDALKCVLYVFVCDRFKSRMCGQAGVLLSSQGPLLSVCQVLLQHDQQTASSLDSHHAAASAGEEKIGFYE